MRNYIEDIAIQIIDNADLYEFTHEDNIKKILY